jgi:hypothetical protein
MTIFVRSNNTDGLDGNVVPDRTGAVWSRRQCIDTTPSSAGAFIPRLAIPTANAVGTLASLARKLLNQWIEAKIGRNVLNRMTRLGMPVSIRGQIIRTAKGGKPQLIFMHHASLYPNLQPTPFYVKTQAHSRHKPVQLLAG